MATPWAKRRTGLERAARRGMHVHDAANGVQEVVVTGLFEGHTQLFVGVSAQRPFRVYALDGRAVLDVLSDEPDARADRWLRVACLRLRIPLAASSRARSTGRAMRQVALTSADLP